MTIVSTIVPDLDAAASRAYLAAMPLAIENIQGNILGGFNKDFQDFLFLSFKSAAAGRAWIAEISGPDADASLVKSSSFQVLKFNGEFKNLKRQGLKPEAFLATAWNNLALTHQGLKALGVKAADLDAFPPEFRDGMAARAKLIGDVDASAPQHWRGPFDHPSAIHAVLIVAADTVALLASRLAAITTKAFTDGTTVIDTVHGRTRAGKQSGHENFGFKDGVSQPGIRGVTPQDDPIGNPNQGQPGQDLLWPGEFVLGYPTQIPKDFPSVDGPNPNPGPPSTSGPSWTRDGSYLVFRRLDQDVPSFDAQIAALSARTGLAPDLLGAKLVGRYKSGCPLETRTFLEPSPPSPTDPGIATPALAESDSLNLSFEFGDDADGKLVPLASHIRKAYPRDEDTGLGGDSESDTQTHRLLRRGIPFGASVGDPGAGSGANDKRGLLFLCYQKSIASQFEFVQHSWVNDAEFPPKPTGRPQPGQDPIMAQAAQGPFHLDKNNAALSVKHFVTTSGGEYFFQPSIDALQRIGTGNI